MVGNFLKVGKSKGNYQNKMIFTESGTFTVPDGITQIFVSGCAAGGSPKAGEFCIEEIFKVIKNQSISITVGTGNTVIGDLKTMIANSIEVNFECHKLGYKTGVAGEPAVFKVNTGSAFSGAFGFGGGNGGVHDTWSSSDTYFSAPGRRNGVLLGKEMSKGGVGIGGMSGGESGRLFCGGAGGAADYSKQAGGAGGGAGGYGAGGGRAGWASSRYSTYNGNPGEGSPGIVIIEW